MDPPEARILNHQYLTYNHAYRYNFTVWYMTWLLIHRDSPPGLFVFHLLSAFFLAEQHSNIKAGQQLIRPANLIMMFVRLAASGYIIFILGMSWYPTSIYFLPNFPKSSSFLNNRFLFLQVIIQGNTFFSQFQIRNTNSLDLSTESKLSRLHAFDRHVMISYRRRSFCGDWQSP